MKKRLFSLSGLLLVCAFTFLSCGEEDPNPEPQEPSTVKQATVAETNVMFPNAGSVFNYKDGYYGGTACTNGELASGPNHQAMFVCVSSVTSGIGNMGEDALVGPDLEGPNHWIGFGSSRYDDMSAERVSDSEDRLWIGLQYVDYDGHRHYAWAQVRVVQWGWWGQGQRAWIQECYYEATPDKPIRTGQKE